MNYTIWRSYHYDNLIQEYNLHETNHIKLFGTHLIYNALNINYANKLLCEMCTMYYVWKNDLYSDFVGFDHYKRNFVINKSENKNIREKIIYELKDNQCEIFHSANDYRTIRFSYYNEHSKDIYDKALDIIANKYGKTSNIYNLIYNGTLFYAFCSFIMPWKYFIKLCDFLFDILFKIDKSYNGNFDYTLYLKIFGDDYQVRNFAFLSERLISFWIQDNFKKTNILL